MSLNKKIKIVVLASGSGTNLQAIINSCKSGYIPGEVNLVISNNRNAYALKRAENEGIDAIHINPEHYPDRVAYDMKLSEIIDSYSCDLIAMAGYMLILSPRFVQKYPFKIINIHPALCPSFPGTHAIKDAIKYRVKVTGVTIHFADEGTDSGPVILQFPVFVSDSDTVDTLGEKIHSVEHMLYPLAIKLFAEDKLKIDGRHIRIDDPIWEKIIERRDLDWLKSEQQ